MWRHLGTRRSSIHNLRLAVLLGLTAGMVNAEGFLGFSILTTNVTGHAALFAEGIAVQDWHNSMIIFLWMVLFLGGACLTSLILTVQGGNRRFSYFVPIIIEIVVLISCAVYGKYAKRWGLQELFGGSLLFAMGIQNALVSMISGSVVRTTHLTGTFTDLGIEIAQLYGSEKQQRIVLMTKIKLHLVIIFFFLTGAVSGAFVFSHIGFKSFYIPAGVLCLALTYDLVRIKVKYYYHAKTHIRIPES